MMEDDSNFKLANSIGLIKMDIGDRILVTAVSFQVMRHFVEILVYDFSKSKTYMCHLIEIFSPWESLDP